MGRPVKGFNHHSKLSNLGLSPETVQILAKNGMHYVYDVAKRRGRLNIDIHQMKQVHQEDLGLGMKKAGFEIDPTRDVWVNFHNGRTLYVGDPPELDSKTAVKKTPQRKFKKTSYNKVKKLGAGIPLHASQVPGMGSEGQCIPAISYDESSESVVVEASKNIMKIASLTGGTAVHEVEGKFFLSKYYGMIIMEFEKQELQTLAKVILEKYPV